MYSLGIIKGSSDGSGKLYFNPTANVSRQEAVTMLGRLTERATPRARRSSPTDLPSSRGRRSYTLSEMASSRALTTASFRPNGAMTRAQVATVLYK